MSSASRDGRFMAPLLVMGLVVLTMPLMLLWFLLWLHIRPLLTLFLYILIGSLLARGLFIVFDRVSRRLVRAYRRAQPPQAPAEGK